MLGTRAASAWALCFCVLVTPAIGAATSPLHTLIEPQLPPHVRSIAEAATYYLAPTGYTLHLSTPRTGDYRHLTGDPAPRPAASAPAVSIDTALRALVPDADLYVFSAARAVAFGVKRPDLPDAPVAKPEQPMPAVVTAPQIVLDAQAPAESTYPAEAYGSIELPPSRVDFRAEVPAFQEPPPAPVETPAISFHVSSGEWLRAAIERAARAHDYDLVWLAPHDFVLVASATFTAESFPLAAAMSLQGSWDRNAPLVLAEAPNRVLIVSTP